jgi:hypothetical protein
MYGTLSSEILYAGRFKTVFYGWLFNTAFLFTKPIAHLKRLLGATSQLPMARTKEP